MIKNNEKFTIIYYYFLEKSYFQNNERYLYTYEINLKLFKEKNPDYEEKKIFLYNYLIDVDTDNKKNKIDIYYDTGENKKQKFNTTNCIKLVQNVWNINESQIKEIKKIIKEHQKNDDE